MTQTSYPQGGYYDAATLPDSGPYSAIEWAGQMATRQRAGGVIEETVPLQIDTSFNDVGVYYAVGNRLEVTNPGAAANTIQIDTGAAMVGGIFYGNDTAVTFTVPSNRTNDLIVVRQNYTGATYTPPASVDADEQVPADTARITRVTALVNDATLATYWDIPLADFTTDGVGAVTINSDDRVWADAETRTYYVMTRMGRNITDGTDISLDVETVTTTEGIPLPTGNKVAVAMAMTMIPDDFIADFKFSADMFSTGTGNVRISSDCAYGSCSQNIQTHLDSVAASTEAIAASSTHYCLKENDLTTEVAGDILRLRLTRDSSHVGDTLAADLWILGFTCEYLGWGRR